MALECEDIHFPSGRTARLVRLGAGASASEAIAVLGLKPARLVLLLLGGADDIAAELKPYIQEVISDGVIRAACEAGAIVIDGGTASGIMAMAGVAAATVARGKLTLLGVAPEAKVNWPSRPDTPTAGGSIGLDPNHSHFVITPGSDWGGELDTIFSLADALHEFASVKAILINGGEHTKLELLQCIRRKWPILVLQGTGRLADTLAESQTVDGRDLRHALEIMKPDLPRADLRRRIAG